MELILTLNRESGLPLYRVLSEAIKRSIENEELQQGQTLPSVRALAKQYQLSVATGIRAYEDLSCQGYVVSTPKSGTIVSNKFAETTKILTKADMPKPELRKANLSGYGQRLISAEPLTAHQEVAGLPIPSSDLLPKTTWQRLLMRHQDCYSQEKEFYDFSADPFGSLPLREAIVGYLKRTRGIQCTAEQVVVTSAVRLDLFCRMLINPGDHVAIENPCFPTTRKILLSHGANLYTLDTDKEGMNPESLFNSRANFRMLHLCPSHQDPTGVALSNERRLAILNWAQRTDTIIWENDYDCNYHYTSRPLPAMQSMMPNDTVIYSGSFLLTLGHLVSSGFVVLPHRYISAARSLLSAVRTKEPVLENSALTEFIKDGYLERYIQKQRNHYIKIRQSIIHHLTINLRLLISFKESSGMHQLVQFDDSLPEAQLLECAKQAGLTLRPTRSYYADKYPVNEFIITFSEVQEETIPLAAKNFASLLLKLS